MAIAHDAVSSAADFQVTSLSWSHVVGSGADRILLVGVAVESTTVSTVTYGGVSLAFVGAITEGTRRAELWRLVNPASGTATIAVTCAAEAMAIVGGGESLGGVHQTTPLGTAATAGGATTTPTVDVTAVIDDWVIDSVAYDSRGGETLTVHASQTQRWQLNANNRLRGAGSTEAAAATTVTMSWTVSFAQSWAIVGVAVKPAAAGGQTIAVGQVTETDLAQAVAWAPKHRLVGQIVETDLAQAITRRKTLTVGQLLELDLAQPITSRKTILVGQAFETDFAQAITRLVAGHFIAVGQAVETDLAQAVTAVGGAPPPVGGDSTYIPTFRPRRR